MCKYIIRNVSNRDKVVYHTEKDCSHIKREEAVVEASETFVEFHDAKQCSRCAGTVEGQTGDLSIYHSAVEAGQSD